MTEEQFIDMMAAKAMQGLLASEEYSIVDEAVVAQVAYEQADAMWKEKHRRKEEALKRLVEAK